MSRSTGFSSRPRWAPVCLLAIAAAALLLAASFATAGHTILVDEIHGDAVAAALAARWPDCTVAALTAADFPLAQILASGDVLADTTITFTVPPGAAMLYGRFHCPDMVQYPFITVHGPDGAQVCGHHRGCFHVEAPAPGEYSLAYASWEPQPIPFEVGTGPEFFTPGLLADHGVVLRLRDLTRMLFTGTMPDYSPAELAVLEAHAAAGGGNYLVREPEVEFALKPIIDLTAPVTTTCDVSVAMGGALTFADPPCEEQAAPGGTVATWPDVPVHPGAITRLAYESALSPPHRWLEVAGGDAGAGSLVLVDRGAHPLREVHLARHLGGDRWELATAGDLRPGEPASAPPSAVLSRADPEAILAGAIGDGARTAGMSDAQVDEFLGRYRWADRVLGAADGRGCWTALFRVADAACDAMLPLAVTPAPATRSRTLWFWVTDIPAGLPAGQPWSASPTAPALAPTGGASGPHALLEYGVIKQRYPRPDGPGAVAGPAGPAVPAVAVVAAGRQTLRDQTWFGWTFHDEEWIRDPVHNGGQEELVWFAQAGGHPDAADLLAGLGEIGPVRAGAVAAPWSETVLRAGPDAYTADGVFPPGSLPTVVVAKDVGEGRAVGIASRELLASDVAGNAEFVRCLLDWVAPVVTAAPGTPPAARIAGLQVAPNPFNPRTGIVFTATAPGPVTVTVHDLAGRRVAELLHGTLPPGEQRLAWDGRDRAGRAVAAGMYVLRVTAGSEVVCRKMMLVD